MVQKVSSAITPLQNMDEINYWENRPFSGRWIECKRNKCTDTTRTIKKKPKRIRTAYTTEQIKTLEKIFTENKYITSERRREISALLNIGDKSVKIWFQNRRMKEKRESSESSDSSNETTECKMSPIPNQEELQSPGPVTIMNEMMFSNQSPEAYQYQFPTLYNEQIQISPPCPMPTENTQFCNDDNVYPTYYYPCNNTNFNDYDNNYYNQFQQENGMNDNYWNANGESCYYYN